MRGPRRVSASRLCFSYPGSHRLIGKIEKIGGVECYVATPSVDYPKDKVILFLTDVFGIPLNNNKVCLLAFTSSAFFSGPYALVAARR